MKLNKIAALLSVFTLTSCGTTPGISESQKPTAPEGEVVERYLVDTRDITFYAGDEYVNAAKEDLKQIQVYENGFVEERTVTRVAKFKGITNTDFNISYSDNGLDYAGETVAEYTYKIGMDEYTSTITYDVRSYSELDDTTGSIDLTFDLAYTKDAKFLELNPDIIIEGTWKVNGETKIELLTLDSENVTYSLTSGSSSEDLIGETLEGGKNYTFNYLVNGKKTYEGNKTFTVDNELGYRAIEESTLIFEDFQNVAPKSGVANVLVVPIELSTDDTSLKLNTFNETNLKKVNDYFFGEKEDTPHSWNSLKTYFEHVSLNELDVQGHVADVYKPTNSNYKVENIISGGMRPLLNLFIDAIKHTINNNPQINWTEYDLNDDGYLDNVHFINNTTKSISQMGSSTPFWPHKYEVYLSQSVSLDKPGVSVYESTNIDFFTDSLTIIHEQSHIFGVDDYYDYSYSGADYIGCVDMQSHNIMDWNTFSKFSVGWAKPYVVDGSAESTTIKIEPSALTNQCIVVPANYSTYNGSAFDEYFLLELYTPDGPNNVDWTDYFDKDFDAGVKLFHVDARLYSRNYGEPTSLTQVKNSSLDTYIYGASNSYNTQDYANGAWRNRAWDDFKLLAIMQKGKVDTFGEADGNGKYDYLSEKDLFVTGDTFEFDDYAHFLSKSGNIVRTMDDGEVFPYKITFNSVTREEAIITISRI